MGSSAKDISRLLLGESLLIGLIGAILGIPAGWALAKVLQSALGEILKADLGTPQLSVGSRSSTAFIVGVMTVMLGAWVTIRQGRNISPVEAMRDHEPAVSENYSLKLVSIAAVILILAAICLSLLRSGAVCCLGGDPCGKLHVDRVSHADPRVFALLVKFAARVLFFGFPVYGLLAVEQLNRRRIRTGLTVGVLVVAVSSGLGLGNAISSSIDDVYAWYRRAWFGEFFLKSAEGTTTEERVAELKSSLDAMPQIAEQSEIRMRPCKVGDLAAICMIRDLPTEQQLPWNMPPAEEAQTSRQTRVRPSRFEFGPSSACQGSERGTTSKLKSTPRSRISRSGLSRTT